jgi:hypothetical protein
MKSTEGSKRLLITCPPDVRRWLEEAARFNGGTMTGEAVRAIRAQMAREGAKDRKPAAVVE